VTKKAGGLSYPEGITFDPSGTYLYVANTGFEQIRKYDARTGASLGILASGGLSVPKDVKFGPDGLLYVASGGNYRIARYRADGTIVEDYVPAGSGGMINPSRLAFGPDGNLFVTMVGNSEIMRFGSESEAVLNVSSSTPSTLPLTINFDTADGEALAGIDYISTAGAVTFPAGVTRQTILIPTLDDSIVESQEAFTVNLYDAVGGTIADGAAIVTIADDDEVVLDTKFYVVDDASINRTYEYDATGGSNESYSLDTGNSAPRGVASHITGETVWVIDANKKVYVYNNNGGLLGSWTAGSLPSNAQVEGITTNGTDIWIVDNRSDRVYRYSGAATRVSGSQNAFGNFGLNSGNRNPKDIVTDGAFLYVVNDSTTDKVFKYQISNNALVASWTITTPGATSPTGITLDPFNPNHLWIVDSVSDSVYEYRNAVTQGNGTSKSADASFLLAAGNTNPQGIADPPAPGTMQSAGSPPAMQSAQQSIDSDPVANGARAVAVDVAMLRVFGGSRPDTNAAQAGHSASVALTNAMRRSREAKVSSVAPFAPTAAPQRDTQTDFAHNDRAAQQAIDELLTLWQPDHLPNLLRTRLS
jgi:sugar lactone lactonase YvrE